MASLTRILQNLFGTSHGTNEVAQFGSLAAGSPTYTDDPALIQALAQFAEGLFSVTGSASQAPRIEDFNGLLLLLFRQLKYLFQAGVAEWISTENYYAGKSVVTRNGKICISLTGTDTTPNIGNDPASDNGTNWSVVWAASNPELTIDYFQGEIDAVNKTGLLIPLYIYPTGGGIESDYANVISLAKKYPHVPVYVILNPSNGPGTVVDGNFTDAINKLHGANVKVLGYVATDYPYTTGHGTVSEAQAQAVIDTWLSFYAIDGIFFDEMSYASPIDPNVQAYYLALMNYGHSKGLYPIIANPGTAVPESYYSVKIADTIVVYENSGLPAESTLDQYSYNTDYPTTRRALLAYGAGSFNESAFVTDAKYVGMIFCNDGASLPNPWDVLTSTLEQQFILLSDDNPSAILAKLKYAGPLNFDSTPTGLPILTTDVLTSLTNIDDGAYFGPGTPNIPISSNCFIRLVGGGDVDLRQQFVAFVPSINQIFFGTKTATDTITWTTESQLTSNANDSIGGQWFPIVQMTTGGYGANSGRIIVSGSGYTTNYAARWTVDLYIQSCWHNPTPTAGVAPAFHLDVLSAVGINPATDIQFVWTYLGADTSIGTLYIKNPAQYGGSLTSVLNAVRGPGLVPVGTGPVGSLPAGTQVGPTDVKPNAYEMATFALASNVAPMPVTGLTSGYTGGVISLPSLAVGQTEYIGIAVSIGLTQITLPSGGTYQYVGHYTGLSSPFVGETSGGTNIKPSSSSFYGFLIYRRIS